MLRRFASTRATTVGQTLVDRNFRLPSKGRYQVWRKPVYYQPIQHPLDVGPDYALQDGTQPFAVTTFKQLQFKTDQIRVGKRIVEMLAQTKAIEKAAQEKTNAERTNPRREFTRKGTQPIA